MARPSILPDCETLGRLLRDGNTYEQIAVSYGVTTSGVYAAIKRCKLVQTPRPDYSAEVPWEIAEDHRGAYILSMLYASARLARKDKGLSRMRAEGARRWQQRLLAQDLVVGYDRDTGFYYTPRRVGVDEGWVREPADRLVSS